MPASTNFGPSATKPCRIERQRVRLGIQPSLREARLAGHRHQFLQQCAANPTASPSLHDRHASDVSIGQQSAACRWTHLRGLRQHVRTVTWSRSSHSESSGTCCSSMKTSLRTCPRDRSASFQLNAPHGKREEAAHLPRLYYLVDEMVTHGIRYRCKACGTTRKPPATKATSRSASTPRACSGATSRWCCTAAAIPRSSCARRNLVGDDEDILYVKGSGWDLEFIEEAGFSPVRMAHLLKLAQLEALSDPQMVNELATHMTRATAPAPSVETILHALLPHKYVDHTHSDAVLAVTDTADGEKRIAEIYGDKVVIIPYVMPGFDLARLCAERFPQARRQEHDRHGADEARHLFVRGDRQAVLRAHDRAGRSRRALSRAAQRLAAQARRRTAAGEQPQRQQIAAAARGDLARGRQSAGR